MSIGLVFEPGILYIPGSKAAKIMTVMKIYRRPFKKFISMYTLKPIVVILALFLLMTIGNLKGFLVFLVIELCVLSFIVANTAIQLFYVVLTENSLIVRNRYIASGMLNLSSILLKN